MSASAVMIAIVVGVGVTCIPTSAPPLAVYSIDCPSVMTLSFNTNAAMMPPIVMLPSATANTRCRLPVTVCVLASLSFTLT